MNRKDLIRGLPALGLALLGIRGSTSAARVDDGDKYPLARRCRYGGPPLEPPWPPTFRTQEVSAFRRDDQPDFSAAWRILERQIQAVFERYGTPQWMMLDVRDDVWGDFVRYHGLRFRSTYPTTPDHPLPPIGRLETDFGQMLTSRVGGRVPMLRWVPTYPEGK